MVLIEHVKNYILEQEGVGGIETAIKSMATFDITNEIKYLQRYHIGFIIQLADFMHLIFGEEGSADCKEYENIVKMIIEYKYLAQYKDKMIFVVKTLGRYKEPVGLDTVIKSLRVSNSTEEVLNSMTPMIR